MKKSTLLSLAFLFILQSLLAQLSGNWKMTGPVKFPVNASGQINGIGRICQVKFHPSNAQKVYAASASGGLWISNDGMGTWGKTGTDNMPRTGCASLCIDYSNDQILYLGTGDPNYYSRGYGIWKSTDGGANWNQSTSGVGNRLIIEILMDPTNHNTLVAATDDGIWKSTDAGASWVLKKSGGDFKSMLAKPGANSTALYAVTSIAFFRSTDMGETWTETLMPGAGLSNGGRIGVSNADPNGVYVTFVGDFKAGTTTPVLKSSDSGLSFTIVKTAGGKNLNGYDDVSNGQGNYNYGMTVDPLNANTVYICSHVVWKSVDAGVNWSRLTSWYSTIHTDMHDIKISPYDNTKIMDANDGGVWQSTDGGFNWTPKSDGLAVTECYHGAQSPIRKDMIDIGTQDNGELNYTNNVWYTNGGGDFGGHIAFDYQLPSTVYHLVKERKGLNGLPGSQLGYPFTQGDANGNDVEMEFNPALNNTAFVGRADVYRTTNLSTDPPAWTKISSFNLPVKAMGWSQADANILYAVADNQQVFRTDNALAATPLFTILTAPAATNGRTSIAAIKSNAAVVYLTCGSQVYRSGDRGATWAAVTANLPNVNILKIYHDVYTTDESVYVCMATGVYYKNNTMSSWLNFSLGLPTIADINELMVFNDGTPNSVLRVVYYGRGVWESPLYANSGISVTLTAPASNADYIHGNTVTFTATASVTTGAIAKVEFYANSLKVGESLSSPYSFAWQNPAAGDYKVSAKAINNLGNSASTADENIKIWDLRLPENPAGAVNGLDYKYYEGIWTTIPDFTVLTSQATGNLSNFDLSPRKRDTNFGFSFKGYVDIAADGIYTFYTTSDDGSQLYIGNNLVVNNDGMHGVIEASGKIGLKAGKHMLMVPYIQGGGGFGLEVRYEGNGIVKQLIPATVLFRVPEITCAATGSVLREYWGNVAGNAVAAIPLFQVPDSTTYLTIFEEKNTGAANFGTRVRGYICPPYTGNYTFWIASDDESELWLSSNDKAAGKIKIASVSGFTASRAWDAQPSQKSISIALTAGTKYYIEALHKQGIGGTNLAVGWQFPNGDFERPMAGNRLSPYVYMAPLVSIAYPADSSVFYTGDSIAVAFAASDSQNSVMKVDFYLDGVKSGQSMTAPFTVLLKNIATGNHILKAVATNMDGTTGTSALVHVTVLPLRVPEDPAGTIAGVDYSYYEGTWTVLPDFSTLTPVAIGSQAILDLTPRKREDYFGLSFTGFVNAPVDGIYNLYNASDDGSKLYIGTKLIANNDGIHGTLETSGRIGLKAGKHAFTFTYFQGTGGKAIAFSYAGPGIAKQLVPAGSLFRILNLVTASNNEGLENSLRIYPNPVLNKLTLELEQGSGGIEKVQIMSIDGKVVFEENYAKPDAVTIDLIPNFASGIYVLTVLHSGSAYHYRISKN